MKTPNITFWENFWNSISLPSYVNLDFSNDKVIADSILRFIPEGTKKRAIEIGCAPGKWLGFLNKELNYNVTGIEYLEVAAMKTKDNLDLLGLNENDYIIINEDFFRYKSNEKYDLVYSFGFIEHFDDYERVMDLHLDLVNDDGYLMFTFPNFKGINRIIQSAIDNFNDDGFKLLKSHNLKIMRKEVFFKYAKKNELDVLFSDYVGGFEPALFNISKLDESYKSKIAKKLYHFFKKNRNKMKSRLTSSYFICVLKKNKEKGIL